jgi:XTP/dITP diphosphohydrolase
MNIIVVATQNAHKAQEIQSILNWPDTRFVPLGELGYHDAPEEDAGTFEGNARIKAQNARALTGLPAIADDSGLVVDALGGAPGVYSSRYAGEDGNDAANNAKLLAALANVPAEQRTARFVCTMLYIDAQGAEHVATGSCEGHIAFSPSGEGGFGYDPLFLPACYNGTRSMASLTAAEKNAISHRGAALAALQDLLAG